MVKVVWTDSAISDLNDIGEHIAKYSERYAQITIERLFNSVDILETNPRMGRVVEYFNDKQIREIGRKNFRIVYKIMTEYRIDILTVHRCERLIENAFDLGDSE